MKQLLVAIGATLAGCAFLLSNPAHAASPQRVFVAAQGSDSNPCTFAAPCRTFQHAHDTVAANGEIDVLDPAGYGAVTITKAISIQGHGYSGITVGSGVFAITINANAGDVIHLQGLLIDGSGSGPTGILFNSGSSLDIIDTVVRHFAGTGIHIVPTTANASISILNTRSLDNGVHGILIEAQPSTSLQAQIAHTITNRNADGIFVAGSAFVSVNDSISSNNSTYGYITFSFTPMTPIFNIDSVTFSNNLQGGIAALGGTIVVGHSAGFNNAGPLSSQDFVCNGGQIFSYQDNRVLTSSQPCVSPFTLH